eukprot:1137682-Pelagomonas_calceolata.AAC.2
MCELHAGVVMPSASCLLLHVSHAGKHAAMPSYMQPWPVDFTWAGWQACPRPVPPPSSGAQVLAGPQQNTPGRRWTQAGPAAAVHPHPGTHTCGPGCARHTGCPAHAEGPASRQAQKRGTPKAMECGTPKARNVCTRAEEQSKQSLCTRAMRIQRAVRMQAQ